MKTAMQMLEDRVRQAQIDLLAGSHDPDGSHDLFENWVRLSDRLRKAEQHGRGTAPHDAVANGVAR